MNSKLLLGIAFSCLFSIYNAGAQGCVAVRQMGGTGMLSCNNYNLGKGDFIIGTNYRYFHSFRHFVGKEEQEHRQNTGGGHDANGVEQGNAVNIYSHALDFNLSYGLSSRLQLNATIPYVHNERSQVLRQNAPVADTFRYSVYAEGIGDMRFGLNYWIFDPATAHDANLMLGLGVKVPTGNFAATDNQVPQSNGTKEDFKIMDQAIQPGDGGWGINIEMQAFQHLFGNFYGYANGYYLFNPKESNGTYKSNPTVVKSPIDKSPLDTLYGYNLYACPDQYFVRAGLMTNFGPLSASLGARWEGIPANDAFGGQEAYRRPGYVIAVEPGLAYHLGNHSFSLFVPFNFVRNRIQSAADIASQDIQNSVITDPADYVHVQGDAAFADYSINIGYSYRFGRKSSHTSMFNDVGTVK